MPNPQHMGSTTGIRKKERKKERNYKRPGYIPNKVLLAFIDSGILSIEIKMIDRTPNSIQFVSYQQHKIGLILLSKTIAHGLSQS